MARNEWSRWGRGDCIGYSLAIGDGGFTRFEGSVTRGMRHDDGSYSWSSAINGMCGQAHASLEEAMARVEFELSITGEAFAVSFAGYKAHRHENKFSQAVDAMRRIRGSNSLNNDGTT